MKQNKQNKHTDEETLNLWIDLENWEFLDTQGTLAFYVTLWHYSPNVLKNIFINVMEICVVKSLFLICLWTPIES